MKTREGIYFGNREIVERYIGGKLVWQKEIVLISGNTGFANFDSTNKSMKIFFGRDKSVKIPDLEPYRFVYKDKPVIKNSYVVINNVKYKDVTIYFDLYVDTGEHITYYFILKFQTLTRYQEVMNSYTRKPYGISATIITSKQ